MKKIKKQKEALLTAAVLCAITGNVFALPTGGVVTSGNVTNVNDPSKVMTAGAHSIIDWKTFDIAKNEKVTFDTKSFMVLNNVNGGQESKILGMLVDQGKGRLLLVNPSGIVLGKDAVINANNITLSTLRISNDQFQKLINGETATFENNDLSKGVTIEKNAKMTLKEALSLYGGKITIADGVEIISKDYGTAAVDILAAKEISTSTTGGLRSIYSLDNGGTNITIGSVNIGTEQSPVAHLDIRGTGVNISGAKSTSDNKTSDGKSFTMLSGYNINVTDSSFKNSNGEMFIVAPDSWKTNKDVTFFELGANLDNNITIDNSNFVTAKNDMTILGGNVDITKSNIDSGNNLIVGAVKNYGNEEGVRSATTYDTSTVTIDEPTTIRAKGSSIVYGAILNVNPNKFKHTIPSDSPLIEVLDRNDLTIDEIVALAKMSNPDIKAEEIRNIIMTQSVKGNEAESTVVDYEILQQEGANIKKINELAELTRAKQEYQEAARNTVKQDMENISNSIGIMLNFSSEYLDNDEMGALSELKYVIPSFIKWNETQEKFKKGEVGKAAVVSDATSVLEHCAGVVENIGKAYASLDIEQKNSLLSTPGFGEAFGVVSKGLALISSAAAATEGIENKNLEQKITGLAEVLKDTTKFGQSAYKLNLAGKGLTALKIDGVHSNADIYCALILSGIEGVAQTFKSVNDYSADGNYTTQELGFTMIDTGFAMLYQIGHTLTFGLDDLIYGTVDKALGGDGNSTMTYAEKAAMGFKNLSVILNQELIQKPAMKKAKREAEIAGNFNIGGGAGIGGGSIGGR